MKQIKFKYKQTIIYFKGFNENDLIYKNIKNKKNFYEIELLEYMKCVLKRKNNEVLLDIGANIGNHSIYLSKYVGKHIISVEANDEVAVILDENLNSNSINNCTVYRTAVGSNVGIGELTFPDKNNVGMARVITENIINTKNTVKINTIDNIINDFFKNNPNFKKRKITAMKLDIEGFELYALQGASEIIAKYQPDLFIEAESEIVKKNLDDYLTPLGYKSFVKKGDTPVYHYICKPSFKDVFYVRICDFRLRIKYKLSRILSL